MARAIGGQAADLDQHALSVAIGNGRTIEQLHQLRHQPPAVGSHISLIGSSIGTTAHRYDFIGDVRGLGVLLGIELVEDRATREPANAMCREAVRRCEAKGLLVQARGSHARTNVIRLVPPMVCTDAEIDEGLAILEAVFAALARDRSGARSIAAK